MGNFIILKKQEYCYKPPKKMCQTPVWPFWNPKEKDFLLMYPSSSGCYRGVLSKISEHPWWPLAREKKTEKCTPPKTNVDTKNCHFLMELPFSFGPSFGGHPAASFRDGTTFIVPCHEGYRPSNPLDHFRCADNVEYTPQRWHIPLKPYLFEIREPHLQGRNINNWQWYCWWFRNPAIQLRLVVYPHDLQGFSTIQTVVV